MYRSDFRRAVTWRTLVRCWLMWSGSNLAGHVCGRILSVLDRKSPIEVRFGQQNWCANSAPTCFHRSLNVEMFVNPFVWPSCHVHAQVFAQRNRRNAWLDWKASLNCIRISADPTASTFAKWLFLTEHATTLGYVLTALLNPQNFRLLQL